MPRTLSARIVGLGLLVAFAVTSISVLPAAPSFASDLWTQIGADIDGEAVNDQSGRSVSSSSDGRTVAIGAPGNATGSAGQVRVYAFAEGTWAQVGADIDGSANDRLGSSVSLSDDGRTVAIGAPGNHEARVYSFNGVAWIQDGAILVGDPSDVDRFGVSVSLSSDGNTVAIGAPEAGDGNNFGTARIFAFANGEWGQMGAGINGGAIDDFLGTSVSLSSDGNTVAIGSPGVTFRESKGLVRIYAFNGAAWGQVGNDIDGVADTDLAGTSVSLSSDGSTVAVGLPGTADLASKGQVRIYALDGDVWVQVGAGIDGEADFDVSAQSVSLSGDGRTVAIGAASNGVGDSFRGHVRIYAINGDVWVQVGNDIDGEAAGDISGAAVSLSREGRTVAIGAPLNDVAGTRADAGQVRVYSLPDPATELPGSGTTPPGSGAELAATGASTSTAGLVAAGFALVIAGGVLVWRRNRELLSSRP